MLFSQDGPLASESGAAAGEALDTAGLVRFTMPQPKSSCDEDSARVCRRPTSMDTMNCGVAAPLSGSEGKPASPAVEARGMPRIGILVGRSTSSMEPLPTAPYLFQPHDQLTTEQTRRRVSGEDL